MMQKRYILVPYTPAVEHPKPAEEAAVVRKPSLQRFQAIQGALRVPQGLLHAGKLQRSRGVARVCSQQRFEGIHRLVKPPEPGTDHPASTAAAYGSFE